MKAEPVIRVHYAPYILMETSIFHAQFNIWISWKVCTPNIMITRKQCAAGKVKGDKNEKKKTVH